MAFIKMGMLPRDFTEMDMFEKAVVIAFLKQYANDKKKDRPKHRKNKR